MAAELNTEKFEDFIAEYPIYEYRLLDTKELCGRAGEDRLQAGM